jgi:TRAP-type C4-dicarboxylate transport system permease small subunit
LSGNAPEPASARPASGLDRLCRVLALAGGLVLLGAAATTVASVTGRYLFSRPIRGDIEILSLAMAVSVSLFLPWCQLQKGHVIVGVFTDRAPPLVRAALDALGSVAIALVAGLLAWRMAIGGFEMHRFGDESMVLRIPTWIGFAVVVPSFALFALAGLVRAWRDLQETRRDRRR